MTTQDIRKPEASDWIEVERWKDEEPFPMRLSGLLVAAILALIATFVWAAFAKLDVVTRGSGRIIPSEQVQVVQSLEGGILSDILVEEGSTVEEGQIVARIDAVRFGSELGEQRVRSAALRLRLQRLEAEAGGNDPVAWQQTDNIEEKALIAEEQALWEARQDEWRRSIAVLESELEQQRLALQESKTREKWLQTTLEVARREQAILDPIVKSGAVPQIEALRHQRDSLSLEGEIAAAKAAQTRIASAIVEVQSRIDEKLATTRSEIRKELNETRTTLNALDQTIRAAEDKVARADIRSPVRGVVNKLEMTTKGSVLAAGRTLMEITPLDDSLLVETRLRPADIGFLHPGLKARVSLTAYDSSQFGSLEGEVIRISSDTIKDERNETFYKVIIKTTKNTLEHKGQIHRIIPGMDASVDIKVGDRTVLGYFLKPIIKGVSEAFREL